MRPAPRIEAALNRTSISPAHPDYIIFAVVMALAGIGLAMVFSSSAIPSYLESGRMSVFIKKQAVWLAASLFIMLIMLVVDYRKLRQYSLAFAAVSVVLLVMVLIPGLGMRLGGSRSWLRLGPVRFQPSEFAKLFLIIFISALCAKHGGNVRKLKTVAGILGVSGIFCLLVLVEPDMGGVSVLGCVTLAILFAAGMKKRHLALLFLCTVPILLILVFKSGYMTRRITAFTDPWSDPLGAGFNTIQSQIAFASGGFWGRGLAQGYQKLFFLPQQQTDFIFSIIGEELGLIGTLSVIGLFVILGIRGFRVARMVIDPFAKYAAFGTTFYILFQALVNMGVATGVLPITGLTLPFVSFGGSSLMAAFMSVGLLLNISGRAPVAEAIYSNEIPACGRRNGRSYIPGDCDSPSIDQSRLPAWT